MPAIRRDIKFMFLGDAKKLTKASQQAQKSLGGVDKSAQKNQTAFSGLAKTAKSLGPVLGAGALVAGMRSAINRAEEMQSQYAITEQIIKTTGGAAGVTGEQVKGMATEMSLVTGIDKSVATEAANVLLTFTNLKDTVGEGNQVFSETLGLTADMATVFGGSAKDAAKQLGKALNDPVANLGALSRAGVTFSDSQKDLIRDLVETGDLLGAQKVILQELERQFGGTAEASADATDKIMNQWKEVQEQLGNALLPLVEGLADVLAKKNEFNAWMNELGGDGGLIDQVTDAANKGLFADLSGGIPLFGFTRALWDNGPGELIALIADTDHTLEASSARWQGLADSQADWTDDTKSAVQAEAELADKALLTVAALGDQEDQTDDTADATRNLSDEMLAAADPFFAAIDAVEDYQEALEAANEEGGISREEALELGKAIGRAKAKFEEFQRNTGSYEAAMELMQEATGLTRQEIVDLIEQGDTLDGSTWTANANVNVNDTDLAKLQRMSTDLAAAAKQGIRVDLAGLRLASAADIEHAVSRAILGMIRTGRIRNIYL